MSAVTEAAQALAGLLRTAEERGLPMPYSAYASTCAPYGHPDYHTRSDQGGITVAVDRLAELAEWASWLEAPIDSNTKSVKDRHHNVYSHAGPIPLNVYALTALADEVSA